MMSQQCDAYAHVPDARIAIEKYLDFYDGKRPRQNLGRQMPDQVYFNTLQPILVMVSPKAQTTYKSCTGLLKLAEIPLWRNSFTPNAKM
jgi:hypothetical protein